MVICVDTEGPNLLGDNRDWKSVEETVRRVMDHRLRHALADSRGRPPVLNWFVVDWVGGRTGRGLDVGYHRILDAYLPWVFQARASGFSDEIHWHYHHACDGNLDRYNRDWRDFPIYEEILSRRLLDRGLWPAVYRAGHTWEDTVCSNWLERWFPFDLSSRAPYRNVHYDWSRAPRSWSLYHPSVHNVQKPGGQKRFMGRSLDIEKGQLRDEEVERAFLEAASGGNTYISFYLHDFRPMMSYVAAGVEAIRRVGASFPTVSWQHSGAVSAFRDLSGLRPESPLRLGHRVRDGRLHIAPSHPIHGEPWLAIQRGGRYERRDLEHGESATSWSVELPQGWDRLAFAAADRSGQTASKRISAGNC